MSDIPLSQPDISPVEIDAVTTVLQSKRLCDGPKHDLFEQLTAERCDRRHGAAVSSASAALHLTLTALGIGTGDQVITTPFASITSANSILMTGAKPVFVDICPQSLNLDPDKLEGAITEKTKAIVAVDVFGNPQHLEKIESIAQAHEIFLIENASEGLGGKWGDREVGSFGRASILEFKPNNQVTTGEGGMMVTDDNKLYETVCCLRNQGKKIHSQENHGNELTNSFLSQLSDWKTIYEQMGYSYRLSEIACALGAAQVQRLDSLLEQRRRVAHSYIRALMDFDDLILPTVKEQGRGCTSWFTFTVRLTDQYSQIERDRILQGMRRHEVGVADYYPCVHLQPFYRNKFGFKKGTFPIAESISQRTIALPFYTALDQTHIELITHTLKVMLDRERLLMQE